MACLAESDPSTEMQQMEPSQQLQVQPDTTQDNDRDAGKLRECQFQWLHDATVGKREDPLPKALSAARAHVGPSTPLEPLDPETSPTRGYARWLLVAAVVDQQLIQLWYFPPGLVRTSPDLLDCRSTGFGCMPASWTLITTLDAQAAHFD